MRKIWNILLKPVTLLARLIQTFANLFWGRPIHIYDKKAYDIEHYLKNPDENIESFWVLYDFENYEAFRLLLDQYPELIYREDEFGKTMVHYMACYGSSRNFEILQAYDEKLFEEQVFGESFLPPLHCALYAMNPEVIHYFVDKLNISPNLKDGQGRNPLNIVDSLQESKSNIPMETLLLLGLCFDMTLDHVSDSGETLLHSAVREQNWQAVELILSLYPHLVRKKNSMGETPEKIAIGYHNLRLFKRLHKVGNQVNYDRLNNRFRLSSYLFELMLSPYFHMRLCLKNRWIFLETLRNSIGVLVFSYQVQGLFYERLPRYMDFYYGDHFEGNEAIHIGFWIFFGLSVVSFIAVYFSEAQFIPTNTLQYERFMEHIQNTKISHKNRAVVFDDTVNFRFERPCHICKCLRQENDKHCYTCNRCTADYDHHCVFLFSCVGGKNLFSFLSFLVFMAISALFSLYFLGFVMFPIYFTMDSKYMFFVSYFTSPTTRIQGYIIQDIMFTTIWFLIGVSMIVATYLRIKFTKISKKLIEMKGFSRRYWKKLPLLSKDDLFMLRKKEDIGCKECSKELQSCDKDSEDSTEYKNDYKREDNGDHGGNSNEQFDV